MSDRIRGVGPALVTPMTSDGAADLAAYRRHVRFVIDGGVHFVVPCGTTGESATLTPDEQRRVVSAAVAEAGGSVPVMAGAGGNDTRAVVALARAMADEGADALLSVTPAYNKPTQEGLVRHFSEVAAATDLPLYLYNVPGRTSCNLLPDTALRLAAACERIHGVKEASGDVGQVMTLLRDRPEGFVVLSGEDDLTLALLALGGDGVISVVANEAPRAMARLYESAVAGDLEDARATHFALLELMRLNFCASNPIPVKTALELMGGPVASFRLPLTPLAADDRARLEAALETLGLTYPADAPGAGRLRDGRGAP